MTPAKYQIMEPNRVEEFNIGRIKKKKDHNVLMENDISMGAKFNRIIFTNL